MAYSVDKETELAMLDKNNRGDKIVIKKIENNGNTSIDIRQYYTNDNDEIKPTTKGVRFNAEMLADVVKALVPALEFDELNELEEVISTAINIDSVDDDTDEDDESGDD